MSPITNPQSGNDQTLYDFQVEGVKWLTSPQDNGFGYYRGPRIGLLADEMGLGKTAQALRAIFDLIFPSTKCQICKGSYQHTSKCPICKNRIKLSEGKRILFLVPGSTIIQWQKQYDRWILDCSKDDFRPSLRAIYGAKSYILNDGSYVMSHNLMASKLVMDKLIAANFDGIVIDEIHKFGATGTKRIKNLQALVNLTPSKFEECRIGLSGTPVRNYAKEIYNIAHFLSPDHFRNLNSFSNKYLTYDGKALYNPQGFHNDFAPFYLRRTVKEVQKSLPEIRRTKLYTEITDPFLAKFYNTQLDVLANFVRHGDKLDAYTLLTYLVKLRHITGIAKAKEPAIIEPMRDYLLGENGIDSQRKVVVGITHRMVTSVLLKSMKDFPHFIIRGGMSPLQKEHMKLAFIAHKGAALAQLSVKAAGEGIDGLQLASCKAYILERQWNGADELQFEKRIHRTGQTQPCHIEITIATGTVDEYFDEMIDEKRRLTTQVEDVNYESNPGFLKTLAEKVISNPLKVPQGGYRSYEDDSILESIYHNPALRAIPNSNDINKEMNDLIKEVEFGILDKDQDL